MFAVCLTLIVDGITYVLAVTSSADRRLSAMDGWMDGRKEGRMKARCVACYCWHNNRTCPPGRPWSNEFGTDAISLSYSIQSGVIAAARRMVRWKAIGWLVLVGWLLGATPSVKRKTWWSIKGSTCPMSVITWNVLDVVSLDTFVTELPTDVQFTTVQYSRWYNEWVLVTRYPLLVRFLVCSGSVDACQYCWWYVIQFSNSLLPPAFIVLYHHRYFIDNDLLYLIHSIGFCAMLFDTTHPFICRRRMRHESLKVNF